MRLGLVEQPQRGVPSAVCFQRNEGLQPLHAQAEVCSSAKGRKMGDDTRQSGYDSVSFIYSFKLFHNPVSSALIVPTKFDQKQRFLQTIRLLLYCLYCFPACDTKCSSLDEHVRCSSRLIGAFMHFASRVLCS